MKPVTLTGLSCLLLAGIVLLFALKNNFETPSPSVQSTVATNHVTSKQEPAAKLASKSFIPGYDSLKTEEIDYIPSPPALQIKKEVAVSEIALQTTPLENSIAEEQFKHSNRSLSPSVHMKLDRIDFPKYSSAYVRTRKTDLKIPSKLLTAPTTLQNAIAMVAEKNPPAEINSGNTDTVVTEVEEVAVTNLPAKTMDIKSAIEAANIAAAIAATQATVGIESPPVVEKESPVVGVATETVTEKNVKTVYTPSHTASVEAETGRSSYSFASLYNQAEKLKHYAQKKGFDTNYAFMIDMGMKSGKKRFFVMDLNTMTIEKRGIVAHGRGNSNFTLNKTYSNAGSSKSTSLGIYKVGSAAKSNYGISYRLSGLEESNSNAQKRALILNGLSCIPQEESDSPICQSEGSPSLSPAFLKEISKIIDSRSKPMLLWIFDPIAETGASGKMAYK